MKPSEASYRAHAWRVHTLAGDFRLEDLWTFDLGDRGARDVRDFVATFWSVMQLLDQHPLAKARLRVGRALHWDDHDFSRPIPGCTESSVAARLGAVDHEKNLAADDAPSPMATPKVKTVYVFVDEALYEFSNDTIHGLLHVALSGNTATLGVYVKHRGLFSRMYMAAIWPARHWMLYPAFVRKVEEAYRSAESRA